MSLQNLQQVSEEAKKEVVDLLELAKGEKNPWPIISKILDVLPFVLRFFPELKQDILIILKPISEELSNLVSDLEK